MIIPSSLPSSTNVAAPSALRKRRPRIAQKAFATGAGRQTTQQGGDTVGGMEVAGEVECTEGEIESTGERSAAQPARVCESAEVIITP